MREANDRGYECLLVEDATESYFPHFKQATLEIVRAQGGYCRLDSDEQPNPRRTRRTIKIAVKRRELDGRVRRSLSQKFGRLVPMRDVVEREDHHAS